MVGGRVANIDMVVAMRALYERGLLDDSQGRWFEGPGTEQLYDVRDDPYELNNLAAHPAYVAEKERMSATLDRFLETVGDWGEDNEDAMRRRLLDADGDIPVTPVPVINVGERSIRISAANNASIAYRAGDGPWQLYTGPIEIVDGSIEAKAVRYGWRESASVIYETGDARE